ncbi:4Fe-4S dicluster domain-containing protein [Methyloceanibacter sp.]|uniref:4Fe-4S dicluster domain-containing protein n=1 Tax=Methyloceanibacter sp. TaxID=1965321 RepID=UPI003D6D31A2
MPVRDTFGLVPPWAEVGLYVLFAPFAVVFVVGLWRRLSWAGLRRIVTHSSGGIAAAIGRFGRFGLLQRRVAQRPRGWPHLGIFLGFLVLLAATTIVAIDWDITRPLGFRVLIGQRYLFFESFADAFGVVFVVGLLAALIWRLVRLRSTGPDQRRIQYQFLVLICGLLYLGLTGFVLEALRFIIHPVTWAGWSFVGVRLASLLSSAGVGPIAQTTYEALWWTHAFVAFSLIASLPYTTFLHSVAAPLNLMAQPGRPQKELSTPFDLRQLMETGEFDVKVGATSLSDLDSGLRFALQACTNCGRCDEVCPAMAMGTALSPRRLVQALRARLLAGLTSEDVLARNVVKHADLWACTTCAACVEACPVFIRPVDYIIPFRRQLVAGQQIDKRQTEFLANLSRSSNAYGLPAEQRNQLAAELRSAAGSSDE